MIKSLLNSINLFRFIGKPIFNLRLCLFIKRTQIGKTNSVYEDRKLELMDYYEVSSDEIDAIYNGSKHHELFNDTSTDEKLLDAYKKRTKIATISHMLSYTRFAEAFYIVQYFNHEYSKTIRQNINMLDYGCSIADYGLSFAVNGYNVTLCDIEGGNIEIGKKRFERRNLKYKTITVSSDELYPKLNNVDIVVTGEVLEHLRDPLRVVTNIFNGLNDNGYLWVSSYPVIEAELGEKHPDHLLEAAEMRLDVLRFLNTNFLRCSIARGYLFKKLPL